MTGKQRLQVLAKYLLSGAVDDDEFDMNKWPQCAIGEASSLPSLEKEGLRLENDGCNGVEPEYKGVRGFEACAQFFKIPYDKAETFFSGSSKSAMAVGKQLLSYVKRM